MNLKEISQAALVERLADELKKNEQITPPVWAGYAKTGRFKERPPFKDGWWYLRTASVLREVKLLGPVGVAKLRTKYGGKKNRGMAAEKFYRGSGSIARKILQQLEKAQLVVQAKKGVHKGRVVSPKGQSLIDRVTIQLMKEKGMLKKKEGAKPQAKDQVQEAGPKPLKETAKPKAVKEKEPGQQKPAPKAQAERKPN